MDTAKYIVIHTEEGPTAAFIFPPFVSHAVFARTLGREVISAGFVRRCESGKIVGYGESESLKKKWRPQDDLLLQRLLP